MTVKLCLGSNRVVVSTYTEATGRDLSNFQLKAKERDGTRYTMLCEKGEGLFIPSEREKEQRIKGKQQRKFMLSLNTA